MSHLLRMNGTAGAIHTTMIKGISQRKISRYRAGSIGMIGTGDIRGANGTRRNAAMMVIPSAMRVVTFLFIGTV